SSPVELRQFLGHFFGGWGRELSLDGLFHNFHRVFGLILVRPSACREERSAATASANCPGGAGNNLACVDSCLDRLITGRNHDLDPVEASMIAATIFLSDSLSLFAISSGSIPLLFGIFATTSLMGPMTLPFFSNWRRRLSRLLASSFSSSFSRASLSATSALADLDTWSGVVFNRSAVAASSSV